MLKDQTTSIIKEAKSFGLNPSIGASLVIA